MENIVYGLTEYSEQEVNRITEALGLKTFIDNLKDGYDTEAGEQGVKLSGGQRQRLAIARAMIRDPEILLLDESTAHLDNSLEETVQKALKTLMRGRITIVVAHRLETIKNADLIVVLENGKVSGIGTHNELQKNNSLYKKLLHKQLSFGGKRMIRLKHRNHGAFNCSCCVVF